MWVRLVNIHSPIAANETEDTNTLWIERIESHNTYKLADNVSPHFLWSPDSQRKWRPFLWCTGVRVL